MSAENHEAPASIRVNHFGRPKIHGLSRDPIYRIWQQIIQRTTNPKCDAFPKYGGRGISICDEWMTDFDSFSKELGPRPSPKHTVDRINNSLGYKPGNCRWATKKIQARNRDTNRIISFMGEEMSVAEWAEKKGWNPDMIHCRIKMGWSDERILTTPPRCTNRKIKNPAPVKEQGEELF